MTIQLPSSEEIKQITRQSLRDKFPLYREEHKVEALPLKDSGDLWIGYRTKWGSAMEIMENTNFDLNIIDRIFYGVGLFLNPEHRGKGLGWKMYETTHDIARKLGFKFIRRSPSGRFLRDGKMVESRRDYLLRKGYVPSVDEQVDLLLI